MEIERRNAYFCKKCRRITLTVDIDEGVIPMFINCFHCFAPMATSFMYQLPGCLLIDLKVDIEWYRPKLKDCKKYEKEHVKKGGLLYRNRTEAKPIVKTI